MSKRNPGPRMPRVALVIAALVVTLPAAAQSAGQTANRPHWGSPPTRLPGPQPPVLDPYPAVTNASSVQITGIALDAATVTVQAPSGNQLVTVSGSGQFAVDVPLLPDRVNTITLFSKTFPILSSTQVHAHVAQDESQPVLIVSSPVEGQDFTVTTVDVAGTVSDVLSPLEDVSVTVEGIGANIQASPGGGGTWLASNVPIGSDTQTVLDVVATDAVGNSATTQVTVTHTSRPTGEPVLTLVTGDDQAGVVGSELSQALQVMLTKDDGSPLQGKLVTFQIIGGDGGLSAVSGGATSLQIEVITDALGIATAYWTLGSDAGLGNNQVKISSLDMVGESIITASANSGTAEQINVAMGSGQVTAVSGAAPIPLEVRVTDGLSAVIGVQVTFTVIEGGGLVDGLPSTSVITDIEGRASVQFQSGNSVGYQVISADFVGNPGPPATFVLETVGSYPWLPTSLSGVALDTNNNPVGGATCTVLQAGLSIDTTTTDTLGRFAFQDLSVEGTVDFEIDGSTATSLGGPDGIAIPTGTFPTLHYHDVTLVPHARNRIGMPVYLAQLEAVNAVLYDNSQDLELTLDGVEGMSTFVTAGSVSHPDGSPVSAGNPILLSLNQVHHDRMAMPLPDGASAVLAWTVQPGGALFDPPMGLTAPNVFGQSANAVGSFLSFDPKTNSFGAVAGGTVITDASLVESDPGSGLNIAGWGSYSPPFDPTHSLEIADPCFVSPGLIPTTAVLPVSSGTLRDDPCGTGAFGALRGSEPNRGIDIIGTLGESVLAVYDGTVFAVQTGCVAGLGCSLADQDCGSGYGNFVVLEHDAAAPALPRFYTAYTQLDAVLVSVGDFVPAGVALGTLGQTGNANPDCFTGCSITPYVHFEMSATVPPLGGKVPRCNPQTYLTSLLPPPGAGFTNPEFADFGGHLILSAGGKPGYGTPSLLARFDELPFSPGGITSLRGTWIVGDTVRELRTPYQDSVFAAVLTSDDLGPDPHGPPMTLKVAAAQPTMTTIGQTTNLTTTATNLFGTPRDVTLRTDGTVYRTSNPSIVTVGVNGLVTAVGKGTAYVAATLDGRTSTAKVEVVTPDPNTTVMGFVWLQDGTPVSGATVTVFPGNVTGTTLADGSFSIAGVPSEEGDLTVIADSLVAGAPKTETVTGISPVTNGLTDAGILRLNDTVYWVSPSNGFWFTPTNWSTGSVPTTGDHVVIDRPESITVFLAFLPSASPQSLRCKNNFELGSSSTLNVATPFQIDGTFTLGGTLADSTLLPGGPVILSSLPFLDNMVVGTDMVFDTGSHTLTVLNGLTLDDATITLKAGGSANSMEFLGTQTLGGSGEIYFQTNTLLNRFVALASSTVTIGPNVTVRGRGSMEGVSGGTFVNLGTLHADTSGVPLTVSPDGWDNQGTITADSGGDVTLEGAGWTSSGSISITGGGTLELGGTFTNSGALSSTASVVDLAGTFEAGDLGAFTFSGGDVHISGTMSNSSLDITGSTATWSLANGTVVDSTLTTGSGQAFEVIDSGNVLDGVTLAGGLTFPGISLEQVAVQNGLTLSSGTVTMNSSGLGNYLNFSASRTLGGTGEVHFATSSAENRIRALAGSTLMIDSGVTVRGRGTLEGVGGGSFVIAGTVRAEAAGTLTISATGVTSSGSLEVVSGATLALPSGITQTSGTTDLGSGGQITATGLLDVQGGVLTGSGTITGDLTLGGILRPGGSGAAGTVTVTGNYTQTSGGTLEAEIGGLTAGSQFDQVLGGVSATLAGGLDVTLISGFTSTPGDSFLIFDTYPNTGTFTPTFPPDGNTWSVAYPASQVRVDVN